MKYSIEIKRSALKEIGSLPQAVRVRVDNAITALANNPFPSGVKKLRGTNDLYRLRVGNYRIVYQIDGKRIVVVILRVKDRKEAY